MWFFRCFSGRLLVFRCCNRLGDIFCSSLRLFWCLVRVGVRFLFLKLKLVLRVCLLLCGGVM